MRRSLTTFALSALLLPGVFLVPAALGQTPTLSSLSPNSTAAGGPGFTLTVNGTGFASGLFSSASVLWNGSALSTSYISANQLTAVVPASLIASQGSASVTAVNPGGATSNSLTFTITPGSARPTLSSLSPPSATPGGPAFTLTVNGSGFLNGAAVQWNGSGLSTSYISANQLTALVPASLIASQGSANVTVANPGGAASDPLTFTIATGLTLSSISPNFAIATGPAFTLTLNGSGFQNGALAEFNGVELSTSYVSASQLTALVPANLIVYQGFPAVSVMNPNGAFSNSLTFTIGTYASAILSSLSPSSAVAGGPAFTLTVNGSNFQVGATVQWNGSGLSTSYISATQLSAFVPASLIVSQGSANITVMNPGGAFSNTLAFTIGAAGAPTLSSLLPSSAVAGGPPFTLTVNGSGFLNGAVVQWNGSMLSTTYVSANQLTAFVPANLIASQGSANVTVANPGGALSNSIAFTIGAAAAPTLSSLLPSSAVAGGPAFTLTVNGSNFLNGTVVQWNGSMLSTTYVSANQLTAFVPANLIASQGSANVTVMNPGGVASNALSFAINPAIAGPTLSSLSPSFAAAGGPAFTLTVNGSNFQNGAVVQWNGSSLSTALGGSGTLTATVPASLIAFPATANISVTNPGGSVSNTIAFTIFGFSSALRIAQIADGSNWKTLFQVVNLDQTPVSYSFQFWDDNGNPLQLPFTNRGAGAFSGTLGVGGTAFAETPGTSPALVQGWAEAASSGRIGVLTIFRQIVPGRPDSEGTVTAVQSGSRIFLPFDNTNGYVTGVAVANTNPTQPLFIPFLFQLENGSAVNGSLSLPAHAHTAFALTTMFPSLAGVRGSIEFTAQTPDIAVVGLRFSPTNSFTSLGEFQ